MVLINTKLTLFFFLLIFPFLRLVQNLVFYGVSQSTGSWKFNPYLSFTVSAFVELLAYIVVHLILDRIGRKLPYCLFATLFGLVAISVLPVQKFMTKDSDGKFNLAIKDLTSRILFAAQIVLMNVINGSLKFLASASYAIIYIYANELFPTNVRNTGMGICSMVARIGAIIGTYCNDSLVGFCFLVEIVIDNFLSHRLGSGSIYLFFSMVLFHLSPPF